MNSRLANKLTSKLKSRIEIFVSCSNLLDMDVFSKSDPMCVMEHLINNKWMEVGRTERIMNNLNPQFSTTFTVDFFFEEIQKVRFSVFDIDNSTPELDDDDFLGSAETTLGEIVSNNPLVLPLFVRKDRAGQGKILLRAVEETGTRDTNLIMAFTGSHLDKKDFFGKSDPYLEFSKVMPDGATQVTHRTEYISNTLNPVWREFEISVKKLCSGDPSDVIKVDCYDHNNMSSPSFIGSFQATLQEFLSAQQCPVEWECINIKKKSKKSSYKNSGVICLKSCRSIQAFSFLDFVFGGLQLKFCVSIDFTASNGDPRAHDSLHSLSTNTPNHYVRAITSVGQVIKDYDSTQKYPCIGFGACIPPDFQLSHCFNLDIQHPYVHGVQGILQSYYQRVSNVRFYGPTNFAPTIRHVSSLASEAAQNRQSLVYHVLLIITDGVISDMSQTIKAIIAASELPMSIIIVGVGDADFDAMDRLDSDDRLLRDDLTGRVAKRDIVQFTPFRDFERANEEELAKHVLAELPNQVVGYYKMVNIPAPSPREVHPDQLSAENSLQPLSLQSGQSSYYTPPPSLPNQQPPSVPYPSSTPYPPSTNNYPTAPYPAPTSTAPYPPSSTAPYPPSSTAPYPQSSTAPYPQSSTAPYPQSSIPYNSMPQPSIPSRPPIPSQPPPYSP